MKCFLPPCFPHLQKYTSKVQTTNYDFLRFPIAGSKPACWMSSRLENGNTYFAFINMKHFKKPHKLDIIEQPYLDKIHSRYRQLQTGYKHEWETCTFVFTCRCRIYHPKQSLSFLSCFSFAWSSTSYLVFHS